MMSNFKIVHEIDGRLRVRFGQYAFTNEQATILKSDILKLEYEAPATFVPVKASEFQLAEDADTDEVMENGHAIAFVWDVIVIFSNKIILSLVPEPVHIADCPPSNT